MKALLLFHSQGGTTARVAEAVAAGLEQAGWTSDRRELRHRPLPDPRRYDLLGVGAPAYHYREPLHLRRVLGGMPSLAGVPAFVFVLYGTYRGDSANNLARLLAAKGAQVGPRVTFRGEDVNLLYLRHQCLFSPGHPTREELAAATDFGRSLPGRLAGGRWVSDPPDPPPSLLYRLERGLLTLPLCLRLLPRFFRLRRQACTRCGMCVGVCPVGNVSLDAEGLPTWGSECILCFYCQMVCPEDAVSSPADWAILRWTAGLNVWLARRDPAIEWCPAGLRDARVQRFVDAV